MSVTIIAIIKSHTVFRLVPSSVTLNDLERRKSPYFASFHRIRGFTCLYVTAVEDTVFIISSSAFGRNWPTLQRGLSAIAELLVIKILTLPLDSANQITMRGQIWW